MLKPSTGVASRFTVRFDTVEELADRVRVFNARLDQGRPEFLRHMRGRWVVEEFLDGQAFSVESLVAGGVVSHVAVCEKGAIQGPYFREIGHSSPPRVADRVARELRRLAEQVIHLIGIDDCVTHAEFKVVGEQPVLLEIGARMGGGSIRQVVRNATGVDLLDLTMQLAMGRTPVATPVDGGAAASRSLYPASAGTVASVDTGPIAAQPGIVDVNLWLAKGDTYRLPPDGYGEVLGVVAAAETADEAIRLAQHAIEVARERTVLV